MDYLLDICGGAFGLAFCSLIILLGLLNLAWAFYIKSQAKALRDDLKGDIIDDHQGKTLTVLAGEAYKKSADGYNQVNSNFKSFISVSEIFPLLGILGTLIALIQYRGQIANLKASFAAAISTTIFGILFAVIFKILEGLMLGDIDFIRDRMMYYQDFQLKLQIQEKGKSL